MVSFRDPQLRPEWQVQEFYRILFHAWGRQHWWPAQSRFEVILGAYLTQNTSWSNVERALGEVRRRRKLSLDDIRKMPLEELEQAIRSAGYFRQKAQRLKRFIEFLDSGYGGSLDRMFAQPTKKLRSELLSLNGIGPETADSILLYAGSHPVFVVDAYTRRILSRHGILDESAPYEDIRLLCERALGEPEFVSDIGAPAATLAKGPEGSCHRPSRMSCANRTTVAQVYNEMHGLLVGVAKTYCLKSVARCEECPLGSVLRMTADSRGQPLGMTNPHSSQQRA